MALLPVMPCSYLTAAGKAQPRETRPSRHLGSNAWLTPLPERPGVPTRLPPAQHAAALLLRTRTGTVRPRQWQSVSRSRRRALATRGHAESKRQNHSPTASS